jgi:hypothetical protein
VKLRREYLVRRPLSVFTTARAIAAVVLLAARSGAASQGNANKKAQNGSEEGRLCLSLFTLCFFIAALSEE